MRVFHLSLSLSALRQIATLPTFFLTYFLRFTFYDGWAVFTDQRSIQQNAEA